MGTGASFPGGKARPGHAADHSPPSSAEVKKEWELYLLSPCPQAPPWYVVVQLYFIFSGSQILKWKTLNTLNMRRLVSEHKDIHSLYWWLHFLLWKLVPLLINLQKNSFLLWCFVFSLRQHLSSHSNILIYSIPQTKEWLKMVSFWIQWRFTSSFSLLKCYMIRAIESGKHHLVSSPSKPNPVIYIYIYTHTHTAEDLLCLWSIQGFSP
jgi:hypothetical protein